MLLATFLVSSLLGSAFARSIIFGIPPAGDAVANAALAIYDRQPSTGEAFNTVAAEAAALDQADLLPAQEWELLEVAASLGADPLAAYQFVRDSIALDPYDGVLRGASGTLAARAGSSWDRALLLRALLAAGGHTTRLAYGESASGAPPNDRQTGYLAARSPLAAPDSRTSALDLERVRVRATRDFALVQLALAEAGVSVGQIAPTSASAASSRTHAWVQVKIGRAHV